jgi:hypothetical protein
MAHAAVLGSWLPTSRQHAGVKGKGWWPSGESERSGGSDRLETEGRRAVLPAGTVTLVPSRQ